MKYTIKFENRTQFIKDYVGMKIAYGTFRRVYEFKPDPNYVIKVDYRKYNGGSCNIMEYRNWIELNHTPLGIWLAPCEGLYGEGEFLIQKKVTFKDKSKYPLEIPVCFQDVNTRNFGFIPNFVGEKEKERVVAADYHAMNKCDPYDFKLRVKKW